MFKLAVAWVTGSIPRGENTYPNHMDLEWGEGDPQTKTEATDEKKKWRLDAGSWEQTMNV